MAGGFETGVCRVRLRRRLYSHGAHVNVPNSHFCNSCLCKGLYAGEQIYYLFRRSDSFASPWGIKDNVKADPGISIGNLCPVQSEQGNAPLGPWLQLDSGQWRCRCLARDGSSSSFLCSKPAFHMSPHVGSLKINE
jgi:hypothetical protein